MTTTTPSPTAVARDPEGFLLDPGQWTEPLARELAREAGLGELTDRHWQVIHFMRRAYLENGSAPSIRALGRTSGVPIAELYTLFPKGPAKLAAKLAGVPKPRGCV